MYFIGIYKIELISKNFKFSVSALDNFLSSGSITKNTER